MALRIELPEHGKYAAPGNMGCYIEPGLEKTGISWDKSFPAGKTIEFRAGVYAHPDKRKMHGLSEFFRIDEALPHGLLGFRRTAYYKKVRIMYVYLSRQLACIKDVVKTEMLAICTANIGTQLFVSSSFDATNSAPPPSARQVYPRPEIKK